MSDCHYEWNRARGLYLVCSKSGQDGSKRSRDSHDHNKAVSEFNTEAFVESLLLVFVGLALIYALD